MKPAILAALLVSPPSFAAEPVRHIGIYVQPFYESARSPDERPRVAVGPQFNDLLSSNKREDIIAARDRILATPKLITPMTMMVLAIRLYDVGLRDDAVFWFYVAKDRYLVMSEVLDVKAQWVETNQYAVMFMTNTPALPGNRAENAKRAVAKAKERVAKESGYFDDAGNVEAYYATRRRNEADVKFCWK